MVFYCAILPIEQQQIDGFQKCIKDIVDISGASEIKMKEIVEYLINDGRMNLLEFPLFEVEDKIITIPFAILVNDWQFTGKLLNPSPSFVNLNRSVSTVSSEDRIAA